MRTPRTLPRQTVRPRVARCMTSVLDVRGARRLAFDAEHTDLRCHVSLTGCRSLLPPRLKQLRDESGPTGLVRCAHAAPGVPVKVLVKQHMVSKVRVILQTPIVPEHGALSVIVAKEDPGQAGRQLGRDLVDGVIATGSRGTLDPEIVAVVVMELLQRLDDQVVDRHPDRPAPIRVAAKESRRGLAWLILDCKALAVPLQHVRTLLVVSRERTNTVVGQKLRFVEHPAEELLHPAAAQE